MSVYFFPFFLPHFQGATDVSSTSTWQWKWILILFVYALSIIIIYDMSLCGKCEYNDCRWHEKMKSSCSLCSCRRRRFLFFFFSCVSSSFILHALARRSVVWSTMWKRDKRFWLTQPPSPTSFCCVTTHNNRQSRKKRNAELSISQTPRMNVGFFLCYWEILKENTASLPWRLIDICLNSFCL